MGLIHGDIYAVSSSKQFPTLSPNYKAHYMMLGREMKNLKVPVIGKKTWEGGGFLRGFFSLPPEACS
jgi:hypothetical protein